MRPSILAIMAAASTTALAASPAGAQKPFSPAAFQNIANVFNAADLDRSATLSPREYLMLREGAMDRAWLNDDNPQSSYNMISGMIGDFARIDANNDARISRTEYLNTARAAARSTAGMNYSWDWRPDYVTVTYYLLANRMDADSFNGQSVMNLKGQRLGVIRDIRRDQRTGHYYALVSMAEDVMNPTPTQYRSKVIGVPLDDILLAKDGASLMLSQRGERYFLTDPDLPRVNVERLQQVDTIYAV